MILLTVERLEVIGLSGGGPRGSANGSAAYPHRGRHELHVEAAALLRGRRALMRTLTALNWSQYALVLVDLQRDFWSEETAAIAPELPDRLTGLLATARDEGLSVVHVRARFRPDGCDWMARNRLRNWIPCIDGTAGVETLPFAVELPGEPVVTKHTFDGFLGTDLDELLAGRGIRGLLVAGLVTSTCVLFTASTATQRGYLVSVVSDCCSDREEVHHATLAAYPFIFDTVRSDEISERRDAWDVDLDRMNTAVAP